MALVQLIERTWAIAFDEYVLHDSPDTFAHKLFRHGGRTQQIDLGRNK